MKKIILSIFILLTFISKVYAFDFHGQFISKKDLQMINVMIEKYKSINTSDLRGLLRNYYNIAAGKNKFLLKKGHFLYHGRVGRKNERGLAILIMSILKNYPNIYKNINSVGAHGETALYIALSRGLIYSAAALLGDKNIASEKADYIAQPKSNNKRIVLLEKYISRKVRELRQKRIKCKIERIPLYRTYYSKWTGIKKVIRIGYRYKNVCKEKKFN